MRKSNLVLTNTGQKYRMEHEWDVAGDAEVEDIVGDIQDLIGTPLLMVEEVSFDNETPKGVKHQGIEDNSYTWTFINLQKSKVMLQCKNDISKGRRMCLDLPLRRKVAAPKIA
jgi:hypothetical protein